MGLLSKALSRFGGLRPLENCLELAVFTFSSPKLRFASQAKPVMVYYAHLSHGSCGFVPAQPEARAKGMDIGPTSLTHHLRCKRTNPYTIQRG